MTASTFYDALPPGMTPGSGFWGSNPEGRLGAECPVTGLHGDGLIGADVRPGDEAKLFRVVVITVPPGLTLFDVDELGIVQAEGSDGLHVGVKEVYADGVSAGQAPLNVVFGTSLGGTVQGDEGTLGGALGTAGQSQLSGTLQGDEGSLQGTVGGGTPSQLSGTISGDEGDLTGTVAGYVEPVAVIGPRFVDVDFAWTPKRLAPLDPSEIDDITFRFGKVRREGESIVGYVRTCEARVGTDLASEPLLVGPAHRFGTDAQVRLDGSLGIEGVTYLLRVIAQWSGGRTDVGAAFIQVKRKA